MEVKTYFSTIAFLIFSHLQNFFKIGVYTHPIDLSCHQKFEKNSPTGSGNIGAQSWKIWKSDSRLDPTLRMREGVHARSIEFLRVRNDRLLSGRILSEKEIVFLLIILQVTRKVTKTNVTVRICIKVQQDLSFLLFSFWFWFIPLTRAS